MLPLCALFTLALFGTTHHSSPRWCQLVALTFLRVTTGSVKDHEHVVTIRGELYYLAILIFVVRLCVRMHEVVSLLSSSPPREANIDYKPSQRPCQTTQSETFDTVLHNIGSSDFEDEDINALLGTGLGQNSKAIPSLPSPIDSGGFRNSRVSYDSLLDDLDEGDFPIEQPTKRRRLRSSPTKDLTQIQKSLADAEAAFDLSSEADYGKVLTSRIVLSTILKDASLPVGDEIELPSFSSSAPAPATSIAEKTKADLAIELSSDDCFIHDDPVISSSQPVGNSKLRKLSDRTTSLLANLKSSGKHLSVTKPASVRQTASHIRSAVSRANSSRPEDDDNIIDSSQPATISNKSTKSAKSHSKKGTKTALDKEADKQRKQFEKETAKEQRRLEKEQQAKEKQLAADKAEVNRKKTDKKKSSEEMIIELPYSIKGKALGNQVEELTKEVDVDTRYYQLDVDMTNDDATPLAIGTIIKWYRKVKSRYNEELEEYETCASKTEQEKHVLVHLTAEEFCALAVAGPTGHSSDNNDQVHPSEDKMRANLDDYVGLLRTRCQSMTLVFLIQGLIACLKKSANSKNREYAAAVRAMNPDSEAPSSSTTTRPSKKRKTTTPQLDLSFLTTDHIEDLTLHLQLSHQPLHIHHTTSVASSAQQISAFTQHLSTRPYRLTEQSHNLAHASFCMASGQFKTGQGDATETFLKMLEQVNRITPSMALGIVAEGYDTPRHLVEAFQKVEHVTAGIGGHAGGSSRETREAKEKARLMLQDVRKALNKNGARSDKRLGPAASKRLYKVFMSKDENLRDGIV